MTAGEKGELRGTEYLVCKQIIRDHDEFAGRRGCRINAEPGKDGGFTVYFTLPKNKDMEDKKFKVIIVEDVKLELKGTEEIFRHEIPNVCGNHRHCHDRTGVLDLMEKRCPRLVLLDLGLGGSTTVGVDICRNITAVIPMCVS